MDNQVKQALVKSTDDLAKHTLDTGSIDQKLATALYNNVYDNIPSGGFPHREEQVVTYLDKSTVRSSTNDGIRTIAVDEKGDKAHCGDIRDTSGFQNLQKIYECMGKVHGGSIGETFKFDDGAGLTMSFKSSDLVIANTRLWQQEAKSNNTFKAGEDLTLVKELDGDKGSIAISRKMAAGNTERVKMERSPWYDPKAPVKLNSVEIVDNKGKVVKEKSFD